MEPLRTAADVRSYFLKHWRQLVPDLMAPHVRVGPARDDPALILIELGNAAGPVRRLVLIPLVLFIFPLVFMIIFTPIILKIMGQA